MRVKTLANRSWAQLLFSYLNSDTYEMGEQCWGMHRIESASINLQISSMWHSSFTHYTALNTIIQRGRGEKRKALVVMLPGSKIVQIVLSPARHNSIFTVSALSVDSIQSGTFWFCRLRCPLASLAFSSDAAYMPFLSVVKKWHGCAVVQHLQNTYEDSFPCAEAVSFCLHTVL